MTKEQIEQILKPGSHKIMYDIDDARAPFIQAYKFVYGANVPCSTCPGSLRENYFELKNNYEQKLTFKMEKQSKYTIREGALLDGFYSKVPELQKHWTKDNITDEIAEKLLEEGFGGGAITYADGSPVEKKSQSRAKAQEAEVKEEPKEDEAKSKSSKK